MFDIGLPEFFIAAIVALLVLGPERLPTALRTLGLWIGRLRRSYYNVKTEIEREIGMDEVRRQLHNEQVMEDVKRVEREVRAIGDDLNGSQPLTDPSSTAAPSSTVEGQTEHAAPTVRTAPVVPGLPAAPAESDKLPERGNENT